jgi:hypothetical protein
VFSFRGFGYFRRESKGDKRINHRVMVAFFFYGLGSGYGANLYQKAP